MKKSSVFLLICINIVAFFTDSLPINAYTIIPLYHLFDIVDDFLQPTDIAIGKNNDLYVVDGVNNTIKVFDSQGKFKFFIGTTGKKPGQFNSPLGITVDSNGRVYVADTGNQRVQIYSADGSFVDQVEISLKHGKTRSDPVDIAVNEDLNHLYVVDNDNHQVLVYALSSHKLLSIWGSRGEKPGQFNYPFFIDIGNDSSVYIVDVINSRVQIWKHGKPIRTIGGWGVDLGKFFRPKGVCIDKRDQVFISDSFLGVIQVFSVNGNFRAVLGTENGEVMKWETPLGLAIDNHQRLFVVEMLANRIRVYNILYDKTLENIANE